MVPTSTHCRGIVVCHPITSGTCTSRSRRCRICCTSAPTTVSWRLWLLLRCTTLTWATTTSTKFSTAIAPSNIIYEYKKFFPLSYQISYTLLQSLILLIRSRYLNFVAVCSWFNTIGVSSSAVMDGLFSEVLLEMSCIVIGLTIELDMQIQFSFITMIYILLIHRLKHF